MNTLAELQDLYETAIAERNSALAELMRYRDAHAYLESRNGVQISTVSGVVRVWAGGHVVSEQKGTILDAIESAMEATKEVKQ